jgi:hypothetical protein
MHVQRILQIALFSLVLLGHLGGAGAEQLWKVEEGRMTFHFYEQKLENSGLAMSNVEETVPAPDPTRMNMETPYWSFAITEDSDLQFEVANGRLGRGGVRDGSLRHAGGLTWIQDATGSAWEMRDFVVESVDPGSQVFYVRGGDREGPYLFKLSDARTRVHGNGRLLVLGGMEVRITGEWARAMNRPEFADRLVGLAEISGSSAFVSDLGDDPDPYVPQFAGGLRDVKLGKLENVNEVDRVGVHPAGISGVSMATTSCNVGDVDVEWYAPMETDHPSIAMCLYREMDGKFEQVGVSYMKHGFFALSNDQCTPCINHSDGTFLGVGCSDTYSSGNNADRTWLGPRGEWNPFTGIWDCVGSHFSGGQDDCIRRHGGSGHNAVDHRVQIKDADLDNSGATYYYEAYYVVRADDDKFNNWGSRVCTMTWDSSPGEWDFSTPASNNDLREGPAVLRWGDKQTWASTGADDGMIIVASDVIDLGVGQYRYCYAVLNYDSDRMARSFSVPVGQASVSNFAFNDPDLDDANDWTPAENNGMLIWETGEFSASPAGGAEANPLVLGYLYSFSFDADMAPQAANAVIGLYKPGGPGEVLADTWAPAVPSSVEESRLGASVLRLAGSRPNPLSPSTTIRFELGETMPVRMDIYDAQGKRIRTLMDGIQSAGSHSVVWDGAGADGRRVGSGVYYYQLKAARSAATSSVVVVQ